MKTSTLTLRIEPAVKEALRVAAERNHRSIANIIEVMIRDHCGRNGVSMEVAQTLAVASRRRRTTRRR